MQNGLPRDLSSELPTPRSDEPASLRQDILDELADHLACSLQRERVKTVNEQQACSNVLNRFGNPASIARKLWFDAMREKIMTQRLTTALMCVMVLAVSGLAVMMWKSLEASQATQAALLAKLQDQKPAEKVPDGWTPFDVKLESERGDPVHGLASVEFTMPTGDRQRTKIGEEADEHGIMRFGLVPWGKHQLRVRLLTEPNLFSSILVDVRPGDKTFRVRCPTSIPTSTVKLRVTPPHEIREFPIAFMGSLRSSILMNGTEWTFDELEDTQILFNSKGQILGEVIEQQLIQDDGNDKSEIQFQHRPLTVPGNRAEFKFFPAAMISANGPLLPQSAEKANVPQNVILIPGIPNVINRSEDQKPFRVASSAMRNQVTIDFGDKFPYWSGYMTQAVQLSSSLKQQQSETQK